MGGGRRAALPESPRTLSLPDALHGRAVVVALNRVFAAPLREGEPDFMQGRSLQFPVEDMQRAFA